MLTGLELTFMGVTPSNSGLFSTLGFIALTCVKKRKGSKKNRREGRKKGLEKEWKEGRKEGIMEEGIKKDQRKDKKKEF